MTDLKLENELLKKQIQELNEKLYQDEFDKTVTITFKDPNEARLALKVRDFVNFNDGVWQHVWRPNNKHGYGNKILDSEEAYNIIEELMEIYNRLREEYSMYED